MDFGWYAVRRYAGSRLLRGMKRGRRLFMQTETVCEQSGQHEKPHRLKRSLGFSLGLAPTHFVTVPELTSNPDIKLNPRLSLRRDANRIGCPGPYG